MNKIGSFTAGAMAGIVLTGAAVTHAPHIEPDPPTMTAPPRIVRETHTVTKTVHDKVNVFSTECKEFAGLVDATSQEIARYENGIAPQQQVLYDTLGAVIDHDAGLINESITAQNQIMNATTGPLSRIIASQRDMQEARADCLATVEGP